MTEDKGGRPRRQPVNQCFDGGECEFVERGLPKCTEQCSIHRAQSSPNVWPRIVRAAALGNGNAARIVERAERH